MPRNNKQYTYTKRVQPMGESGPKAEMVLSNPEGTLKQTLLVIAKSKQLPVNPASVQKKTLPSMF